MPCLKFYLFRIATPAKLSCFNVFDWLYNPNNVDTPEIRHSLTEKNTKIGKRHTSGNFKTRTHFESTSGQNRQRKLEQQIFQKIFKRINRISESTKVFSRKTTGIC
ncbi:t-SNARE [Gigaspora margarita]|uniref:t-SNARE n=1 Tax=Gigaspora margarita TaxID=4874 RepID=A0A8H3X7I2_GIGMA|nr:t-SNARE [Gigaspora margarita]